MPYDDLISPKKARKTNLCNTDDNRTRRIFTSDNRFALDLTDAARHLTIMLIYKIFRADEWATFHKTGETLGAPVDLHDSFIHFSTATQVAETAAKHFAGAAGLMLLACDADQFGDNLKWEVSRGDDLFPHLFNSLNMTDIIWAKPLPCIDGQHQFPKDMSCA